MNLRSSANKKLSSLKSKDKSGKDPVIEAMEKFMHECENVNSPLRVHNGKIYDTDNLLDILGNTKDSSSTKKSRAPSTDKSKSRVREPPRQRSKSEIPAAKKVKLNKTATRRKPPLVRFGKENGVQWVTCENLWLPKKRKARCTRHYCSTAVAKVTSVSIRNDSRKVSQVQSVKKEVGSSHHVKNLTPQSCYMLINFPLQTYEEVSFTTLEPLDDLKYQRATLKIHAGERATVFKPDIRYDLNMATVDLTEPDDNDGPKLDVTSEKECANTILPIIYSYSEVYKKENPGKLSELTKTMGYTLVQLLSTMYVKNINMLRFLEIVAAKLGQQYNVFISANIVAQYLNLMLEENRDHCKNRLTQNLLKSVGDFVPKMKDEDVDFDQAVTELGRFSLQNN